MQDRARFDLLADSYLKHLLLILDVNDRGSNPRNILDPWWSFTRGYPFVKGAPNFSQHTLDNPCACGCDHGDRLPDWMSIGAKAAIERRACKKIYKQNGKDIRSLDDRLIAEHAVPFAVIVNILYDRGSEWDIDSLRQFLNHHFKRALLTKAEDNSLNDKRNGRSLQADMPVGWTVWGDPFARYHDRGIIHAD